MKSYRLLTSVMLVLLLFGSSATAQSVPPQQEGPKGPTVNEVYPSLTSGGLSCATLGDLPEGVLLRAGSTEITALNLAREIENTPDDARAGLEKNRFFMLEQMATQQILMDLAKKEAASTNKDISSKSKEDVLDEYFGGILANVQVTDEEVARFYQENKEACGGATLEQMKDQLKPYVAKGKRQAVVREHIRDLGQRTPIVLAASWVKSAAATAKDNPVDRARGSGKPTMVDFGASGCRPCDMMTPILADLQKKYEGKANVLFVHVREEEILASRYGIQSIPVQVFFDKQGKETYRHTGFFPQADIEKRLAEMGAQ